MHYGLHFVAPYFISKVFFKSDWRKVYFILLATMLVDLDHLLAYPDVFIPDRCSIGFHPLHSYYAIGIYFFLLFPRKSRIWAVGLLFHMATDFQDCLWI
ncbi:MAG: DUF6122 family protein [Saprospiraceae bacterium]|nr:DUF6122 family protein [Saprospiraceae bacterium]